MTTQGDAAYEADGYVVRHGLLDPGFCNYLTAYLVLAAQTGRMTGDGAIDGALALYGDPAFEVLLTSLADDVGTCAGAELVPTYSYARIYQQGGLLERHRDRAACEHSASIHLGSEGGAGWPLELEDLHGRPVSVVQAPGDAVVYQGMRLTHWRDALPGRWHAQLFLHWVRADGPHAAERFDRRPGLAAPKAPPFVTGGERPS